MNLILEHREMHSGEDEFERREKLLESADKYGKSSYGAHLMKVALGKILY